MHLHLATCTVRLSPGGFPSGVWYFRVRVLRRWLEYAGCGLFFELRRPTLRGLSNLLHHYVVRLAHWYSAHIHWTPRPKGFYFVP